MSDWGLFGNGTLGYWDKLGYIKADGVMEVGKFIDFHESDIDADDYDYRIMASGGWLIGSGGVSMTRSVFSGAATTLPTLGQHNNSTALSLVYSGDPLYGLSAGTLGDGRGWIQVHRNDSTATHYSLRLQPLGGGTQIGTDSAYAWINDGSVHLYTPGGQLALYDTDAADPADRVVIENNSGFNLYLYDNSAATWRQTIYANPTNGELYLNQAAGNTSTYIGNFASLVRLYGGNGNIADLITDHASTAYLRLYYGSGANLACYWYRDGNGYGFVGPDGAWDIRVGTGTSDTTFAGSISVPTGYGYYLNGMLGTKYLADAATTGSYGGVRCGGSTGGYGGLRDDYSGVCMMFDSDGNGGFYREANAKWYLFYYRPWDCWAIGAHTTDSAYRLYVTGSAYSTGSWATSDERKKRDIKTIPYALDRVSAMRGVEYRWREDADVGQDPEQWHVGVIAQEIQAVVPEAVQYASDADSYAVDYNGLVGLLIQAVKELREEVNELKTERRR